jgi:hypothetical protein
MHNQERIAVLIHVVFVQWAEKKLGIRIISDERCDHLYRVWLQVFDSNIRGLLTDEVMDRYRSAKLGAERIDIIGSVIEQLPDMTGKLEKAMTKIIDKKTA